ncbi:MAG: NRPS [Sclerophora amabilis]|nr:MAG: NRPS [Sclerophora amabilis]
MSTAEIEGDRSTLAERVRQTAFPNLAAASHRDQTDVPGSWQIADFCVPEEVLARSWAVLLRAFTGEERPVFTVDGEIVTYDLERGAIYEKSPRGVEGQSGGSTGIFTHANLPSTGQYALHLEIAWSNKRAVLVGSSRIPPDFVSQIGRHLLMIIRAQTHSTGNGIPWHLDEHLSRSILNPSPKLLSGPRLLHQLVGQYAKSDDCAVDFLELDGTRRRYDYQALHRCADTLASKIRRMFSEPSPSSSERRQIVPMLLPQSAELYIAILAILQAGAAFCPLNLDAPIERVKFVVKDVSASLLITNQSFVHKVSFEDGPRLLSVDDELPGDTANFDQSVDPPDIDARDLAYVMYTSGSTGTPKGVGVSHLAATQSLLAHHEHIPNFDRFLQFAAPTFDVFVFEMFFPLFRGRTLIGCDRGELLSDLPGILEKMEVDGAELTPSVVGGLLKQRSNAPCLKVLLTIGEMLTQSIVDEFGGSSTKSAVLHGMYGPTEAAIHCTLASKISTGSRPGDIGVPLSTVSAFIVRSLPKTQVDGPGVDIEILPIGQVGELAVGGHQLADGYLNRPDQTANAFVTIPEHGLIYLTGDKARLLPNGRIECLGRISSGQVKLRGQRVELGEIEDVVSRVSGVHVSVASVIEGTLVVFCLAEKGVFVSDIIKTCKRWLPGFMVPADVVVTEELPRLPSGKIDRKKMNSDYEAARVDERSEPNNLENDTERGISSAIFDLLNVEAGRKSSLSALGLDSLMAIRLATRLRSSNTILGAVELLNADTIENIARAADEVAQLESGSEHNVRPQALPPSLYSSALQSLRDRSLDTEIAEIISCSPSQSSMLIETLMNNQAYCNWIELQFPSSFTTHEIASAIQKLAQHNSILRSGFMASDDSAEAFLQVVWKELSSSQFQDVSKFNYEFAMEEHDSLLHPLKIQLRQSGSTGYTLVQIHHALYDGWSWEHCMNDLNAILKRQSIPERPQYWQVTRAYDLQSTSSSLDASKQYWQEHLLDAPTSVLPNYHGRIGISPGMEVVHSDFSLSTSRLTSRAQELGLSAQTFFQGAFAYILSCYMGNSDLVFGSACSGRTLPVDGIEDIIGPCVTTLPIRVNLSELRTFHDLLQKIQTLNRRMLDHCMLPLRDIKKSCGVDPGTPIFDTLIVWQQTLSTSGQDSSPISQVDSGDFLEFNLTLEIEPKGDTFHVKANYQRSVLPASQVQMLLKQTDELVTALIEQKSMTIEDAPINFHPRTLSIENIKPRSFVGDRSLPNAVEQAAQDSPESPAIEFASSIDDNAIKVESLSYNELNQQANRVARCLQSFGVKQDDIVCVCMEKSIALYVSILGIVKAGAGYLPLVPETPTGRLQHVLTEAQVRTCVTSSALRHQLEVPEGVSNLYVDEVELERFSPHNLSLSFNPSDLAYVVFTSGSTGTPKGVLVTQGNLLSNLNVLANMYLTPRGSKLLQACSQAFDVSVFEIFFTWHTGMCLCSATKDVLFHDIENATRMMQITHLSLTPTVAALINPQNVPKAQFLVTAGEAVTQKVFDAWADRGLFQGYGPSETTNICTVNPKVSVFDSINNLGPALRNTSTFVLSNAEKFMPVVQGGVGELCFGGEQVCREYLNKPDLNAQKFIDHPEFGRLYRSGDYGRLLPDGSLIFVGRQDDQVKLRGQRVELGEINGALLRDDRVEDCFTLVSNQDSGTAQQLVSFWVPRHRQAHDSTILDVTTEMRPHIDHLYSNLASSLPAYMIPTALIPLTSLPRTDQGKIHKRNLMQTLQSASIEYLNSVSMSFEDGDREEWSRSEVEMAEILAKNMKIPISTIQRNTSFFSLGLDSISAITLSRSIAKQKNVKVDVSTILKNPSVSGLSRICGKTAPGNTIGVQPSQDLQACFNVEWVNQVKANFDRQDKSVEDILPCTPLQEAMLASGAASSGNAYYNHTWLEVHGDVQRLRSCWSEMAERHSILRTCFVPSDSPKFPFAQVVLSHHTPVWHSIRADPGNLDSIMRSQMDKIAAAQIEREPPYGLTVAVASDRSILMLSMHHALYDGVAISQLLDEVETRYHKKDLAPPVQFSPFLQSMLSMDVKEGDIFWEKTLKDLNSKSLNLKVKSNSIHDALNHVRSSRSSSRWPLSDFERSCKRLSTTMLAAGHAAWARLLCVCLNTTDVCFGNVVSGRTAPVEGVERLVAPCFNTLPIRAKVTPGTDNEMLIRSMQSLNSDCLPFQFMPLRRIKSNWSKEGGRLFDTLFILQQPRQPLDDRIWSMVEDFGEMDLPLVLELTPNPINDTLEYTLQSQSSLLKDDLQALITIFDAIFMSCLSYPAARTQDFEFLDKHLVSKMKQYEADDLPATSQSKKGVTSNEDWSDDEILIRDVLTSISGAAAGSIRRDTTIYKLGLDSISAIQVVKQLRDRGKAVSAAMILEHPSISELGKCIQESKRPPSPQTPAFNFTAFDLTHRARICRSYGLDESDVHNVRPSSSLQSGMIAQFTHSEGLWYFNHVVMKLDADADPNALKLAWKEVARRHEMLRTGFVGTDDPKFPFAMITFKEDASSLPWTQIHVDSADMWNTASDHRKMQGSSVRASFHLPPWRLTMIETDRESLLQFSAHHALYDAQSLQLILSDVARYYNGDRISDPVPINPLLDAILRGNLSEEEECTQFWNGLRENLCVTRFPNLTPLSVQHGQRMILERHSSQKRSRVEAGCQTKGVTMQAAIQTAWARILAAYVGESSVVFGTVFSGRSTEEDVEDVVFPSVTTLPVPCLVDGSNASLLAKVMKLNSGLRKYQFTPLRRIQQYMSDSKEPLFDTILAYQKNTLSRDDTGKPWEVVDEEASVEYSVSIEVEPDENDLLRFRISFKDDHLPMDQARILLDQLDLVLLDTIFCPEAPSTRVSHFPANILSITPPKEPEIPSNISLLHEFVEMRARTQPTKIALEFATSLQENAVIKRQWTFAELDAEGNRIANLIDRHRIPPASLIGICFDKCPEASFAMLGTLKAGCAFVALDPAAPIARRSFIVKDSRTMMVLTLGKLAEDLRHNVDVPVIDLSDEALLKDLSTSAVRLNGVVQPSDTCYCLYTSGTTGLPKGCELTHENTVQALLSFQRLFKGHWDAESRFLQFASFHFDVSILEQYWSWSVGICVTSAPRDLILEDIAGAIRQLEVTHIDLTPSLARIMHPDDVPSLCRGVFITGGEQLKQEIIETWGPKQCIYNGYGPTEATIGVTMFPRVPVNGKPSNIGRQFDNVGTYVLKPGSTDSILRGGMGELCVSGKLVGRGYLNRPDLTEKSFPFIEEFGERIYRTGDLVRQLCDGSFEFLGRADDQVKLRGQRLEIGEINEIIRTAAEEVFDVSTLVVKHGQQQKEQLVSFVVTKQLADPKGTPHIQINSHDRGTVSTIRDACERRLPNYMVPTHIVPMNSFPLSANNKADIKKLREAYKELSYDDLKNLLHEDTNVNEIWLDDERSIGDALAKFTGSDAKRISKTSNIFELGLDSISVIGFCRLLREKGFAMAQTSTVFQNPSIDRLTSKLRTEKGNPLSASKVQLATHQKIAAFAHQHKIMASRDLHVSVEAIESIAPCTALQEGMITRFLGQDKPVYFESFQFELSTGVNLPKLRDAWDTVTQKCQILRTRFISTSDGLAQVVMKDGSAPWDVLELSADKNPDAMINQRHNEWWQQNLPNAKKPFELLIVHYRDRTIMLLHVLHVLYDGNSLPKILSNVAQEYCGMLGIEYGTPFHDALAQGPLSEKNNARAFWMEHLKGAHCKFFPRLADNPSNKDSSLSLDLDVADGLDAARKNLRTTHQALVQACWISVIHKYLGFSVTVGMVVSGRSGDYDLLENVIGPLFNTIPFHVGLEKSESWKTLVDKCHNFNVAALPYQHTPLRDVSKWCKRSSAEPLFDTLFVFQREQQEQASSESRELWTPLESGSNPDYPLAFEAEQQLDGTLRLTIAAQAGFLDKQTCQELLQEFEDALRALISDPTSAIFENESGSPLQNGNTVAPNVEQSSDGANGLDTMQWTPEACKVRDEIASLAAVGESSIDGSTSIFELGLDSIDAIKLSSRLKDRGLTLSVSAIMKNPTVEKMVQSLSNGVVTNGIGKKDVDLGEVQRQIEMYSRECEHQLVDVEEILPVTPLQEAMIAEMRNSKCTRYFNHDILRLQPGTDVAKLRESWDKVCSNTPILRTSFFEIDNPDIPGSFAQAIHRQEQGSWQYVQISGKDAAQGYLGSISDEVSKASDNTPPIRLTLVKAPEQEYLILSLSHALYDGWSLGLLHKDVQAAYYNRYSPRPSYKPTLEHILSSSNIDATNFWKDSLKDLKPSHFPHRDTETSRLTPQTHRYEYCSKVSAEKIQSFCKAHSTTVQAIGQMSWACVLSHHLQSLEVVFGTVLSGRDSEEANEIMFPTMNTVPVRSIIHGTRKEMLRYTQENHANIIQHQHFPLRKAQGYADTRGESLFDTLFIYQKQSRASDAGEATLYDSIGGESEVEYPVCVEMEIEDTVVLWRAACGDSALSSEATSRMLEQIDSVLCEIIESPDAPTLEFPGDGVSICELPPFLRETTTSLTNGVSIHPREDSTGPEYWSAIEATVRRVLATVSKVPEVEITKYSTIFHLGLDSISAIKVTSLLRKEQIQISVSNMLKAATVEGIAQLVSDLPAEGPESDFDSDDILSRATEALDVDEILRKARIDPLEVSHVMPATAGQVYMLSMWQNSGGSLFYPTFQYEANVHLDPARLEVAWKRLLEETPILRTTFMATRRRKMPILQVVLKDNPNSLVWLPAKGDGKNILDQLDLTTPPVCLYAHHHSWETSLKLRIHHSLYDGVSLPHIVGRLQELYNNPAAPEVSTTAFKYLVASDFAPSAYEGRKGFWMTYLANSRSSLIPTTRESSITSTRRTEIFNPDLLSPTKYLETFARTKGLSIQAIFLAAFARVYASQLCPPSTSSSNHTSLPNTSIVIGVYLANRSHPFIHNLSDLPAPTVNLVPLCIKDPSGHSLTSTAQQIQRDLQEISTAQNIGVSLDEIREWTGVTVNCFVNFLSLPDFGEVNESTTEEEGEESHVGFKEINTESPRSKVVDQRVDVSRTTDALEGNVVRDAYLPSLDIEATIRQGILDVGCFAPTTLLGLQQAEGVVERLRLELEHVCNAATTTNGQVDGHHT